MPDPDGKLQDRILGNLSDSVFEGIQHEKSRQYILGIVKDYADHVDFMKKVKQYAGEEIDSRMFRSVKFWTVTILSSAVSATLGVVISKLIH